MDLSYGIFFAMVASLVLLQLNLRLASPIIAIFNRWLRWFIFAFGVAYVAFDLEWIDKPYWVLVLMFALLWFLFETIYNWLAIAALSQSPMSLFPKYALNPGGDEWPVQKTMRKQREWLRSEGYISLQALRAEVAPGIYLRMSVFEHPTQKHQLQILFFPQPNGALSMFGVVVSILASGKRLMTDNLHVPFGGFYPVDWNVERFPWQRSLKGLIRRHEERVSMSKDVVTQMGHNPLAELELTQRELERLNTELGFLFPQQEREQFGKITQEGRYRVWKEIWMLDYLGCSSRYSS